LKPIIKATPLMVLLLLLGSFVMPTFTIHAAPMFSEDLDGNDIDEDGFISDLAAGGWSRNTVGTSLYLAKGGGGDIYRGYVVWDISDIPSGVTVVSITLLYEGIAAGDNCEIRSTSINIAAAADNAAFWDIGNGTAYTTANGFPVLAQNQQIALNAQAVADLNAALSGGAANFTIGIKSKTEGVVAIPKIASEDDAGGTPKPTLRVAYNYPYQYVFTGGHYENGTAYPAPVLVTAHAVAGTDTFNVSGGEVRYGTDDEPIMFSWDLGGGYSRRIYPIGSENYTVTIPDDTFAVYSFDIRDYTLSVETEGGYLEAWRIINGTDTLIERNEIKDTIDDVSLNLVTNRVYRIRIRLADGTVYDFGYFTPGIDTSRTLVIDDLEYDDYAHVYTRHITIEAYRLNATHLQANYEDTRGDTTSIYVEISVRGGAQVYNTTIAAATGQVNWYSAVDYVSYTVLVNATHPSYRNGVVYSRTFIGEETHPDMPDFDIIGLPVRIICTGIVFLVGCTVSSEKPEVGLFVATSVAAAFVYYGALPLGWSDIIILYVLAVGIGLGGRVR